MELGLLTVIAIAIVGIYLIKSSPTAAAMGETLSQSVTVGGSTIINKMKILEHESKVDLAVSYIDAAEKLTPELVTKAIEAKAALEKLKL